ncbi:MAG: TonB family protein [Vicinamibacterales bacterium]
MLGLLIAAVLFLGQDRLGTPEAPSLVAELGARHTLTDGILALKGSRGWLRTRRPVLDFRLEFEFRAMSPDAEPGLMVRTWIGRREWPERGYRVRLPTSETASSPLFAGVNAPVVTVKQGSLNLRPSGEWQTVRVLGAGRRVQIAVNDTVAGEFEIDRLGGFLLFENRRGLVELRNIKLAESDVSVGMPANVHRSEALQKGGGRLPRVVDEIRPVYTSQAMRERIEGQVVMEALVSAGGAVEAVNVTRSLHADLDRSAVAALKAWKFDPAVMNGKPVPVVVEVEMSFTLK